MSWPKRLTNGVDTEVETYSQKFFFFFSILFFLCVSSVRTKLYIFSFQSSKKRYHWTSFIPCRGAVECQGELYNLECYCFKMNERTFLPRLTCTHLWHFSALISHLSIRQCRRWKVSETQKRISCPFPPDHQHTLFIEQLFEVVCSWHWSWTNHFGDFAFNRYLCLLPSCSNDNNLTILLLAMNI